MKREVTEKKTDFKEHYEYLLENNYSFVLLNAYSERKFVSIGKVRKYDSWYLIIDQEQIILYSKDGYIKVAKDEFSRYQLNTDCKGPMILEIVDIKRFANLLEENFRIEIMFTMAVGIKYSPDAIIKKKVDLKPLDLEGYYNFDYAPIQEKGIEVSSEIIDELEKQSEGIYYLSIDQGNFEITKNDDSKEGRSKAIKVQMDNKEVAMKPIRVYLQKMAVKFTTDKVNLIIREKSIVLTNNKEYQVISIVEYADESVENE